MVNEADTSADLAFVNGTVSTMDGQRSATDAVSVHRGRIAALGNEQVRACIGPGTEVVDLHGRLLLPGFHDAHAHPLYGGMQRLRCDLSGSAGPAECLRRVGNHARRGERGRPPRWILGGGWEMSQFPSGAPDRERLDTVTGDRPAFLLNRDHHSAWVNSAALRLAGVDRTTTDPPDGRIERDGAGDPSGTLHEGAAELVARILPPTNAREYREGLLEGQRYLQSYGVTAWHDAIIGSYLGYRDTLDTYMDLDRRGLLTGKARGALWWDRDRDTAQVEDLIAQRERAQGSRFRANAVKIMVDGICENLTASLRQPYLGGHDRGMAFVDSGMLDSAVHTLISQGFQLHFHAVGDRAIRDTLEALAHARERTGSRNGDDLRHQIAHLQVMDPQDVPRFAEIGVTANVQAAWAVNDADMTELTTPLLGRERARWQYPFRALRDAGAVLAAGSDWPVSDADPLLAAHVAVNRSEPGNDQNPFMPEQALPLDDIFAAYTIGSAWVDHLDQHTGSLRPGKDADLVLLDRDPFSLPSQEIGYSQVDLTVVDGRVVYERGR